MLEKKSSVTDAEELKAINKQINALQEALPYSFAITLSICSPKPIV